MKAKSIYILGLNTTYHELSACLLKDGMLIAAIEEERLSRIKHGKSALISNPDVLPLKAIEYCLHQAGVRFKDIARIGLSFCPKDRLKNSNTDPYFQPNDWGSVEGENLFYKKLMNIPTLLSKYAGIDVKDRTEWVPHHISHAGSGFYVSPFKNSAILSIDGIGEISSTWLGEGHGNKMSVIKTIDYPNSIGFLWEKLSKYVGFGEYDASKVMGLASYGNWKKYYPQMKELVTIGKNGEFTTDIELLKFRLEDYTDLEKLFGVKKIKSPADITEKQNDIAASLQKRTTDVILSLGKYLAETTGQDNLCMAGGVALNCVSNYNLMKSGYFKKIYIQPAANDAGTALGAAYHLWSSYPNATRPYVMKHPYIGSEFSEEEMENALLQSGSKYQKYKNIEKETARLIAKGNIIGWFQGKMEWGPRALGNRSLIADPRNPNMKEILNLRIKKREPFRPFAPSVLSDAAIDWFEIPQNCTTLSMDFMEFTFPVRKSKQKTIPAVTHVDGTSRIQTVKKATNPKYYKLINEFEKITGVPMILNTSFNENEPIVCSPNDAINTFNKTQMDYLVLGNFLVSR